MGWEDGDDVVGTPCILYRVTVAEGVAASLQCCVVVRAAILLQDRYLLTFHIYFFRIMKYYFYVKSHVTKNYIIFCIYITLCVLIIIISSVS